jgi:hypothetical protein
MSRLSELPEREKDPGTTVGLGEIFRVKEYMTEIKGALKKGYTFKNLAEIFTEKCGVNISARQIKYHFTRAKNLCARGKTGKNADKRSLSLGCAPSADAEKTEAEKRAKENPVALNPTTIPPLMVPGLSSGNSGMERAGESADPEAFSFDMRLKES